MGQPHNCKTQTSEFMANPEKLIFTEHFHKLRFSFFFFLRGGKKETS